MKKLIFLLSFMFVASIGYSQIGIRLTEKEVHELLVDHTFLSSGIDDEGDRFIKFEMIDYHMFYFFKNNFVNTILIQSIIGREGIIKMIRYYNDNYKIIDDGHWGYLNSGILSSGRLVTSDEDIYIIWEDTSNWY